MARILLLLLILVVVICYGAYLIKGDRRYLRLLGQIIKYALIAVGLFFIVKFI
jgi:hypothetical protein